MQKTALKQMYPAKPMPPVPEQPRRQLTERDCRRTMGYSLLTSAVMTVLALLFWHGSTSFGPMNIAYALWGLLRAGEAWQNLRRIQRGEIVTVAVAVAVRYQGSERDSYLGTRAFLLGIGAFFAAVLTIMFIVHVIDFRAQGRWKWELVGLCLAWPVVIWCWKRLAKKIMNDREAISDAKD